MAANWIVSANAGRARFFSQEHPTDPLEEINNMVDDSARQRMTENIESDKLGPTAAGKSQHGAGAATPNKLYEPHQTPEKHAAELFARDIVDYLRQGHQEGRFQQLSLVASPQFLGMLRSLLGKELESVVSVEIDKDYTGASPEQLRVQIQSHTAKR